MAFYRQAGEIPPKRHTQHRRPDGGLYYEELVGEEGFSSDSSLLYHSGVPSAIVDARPWELPDQTLTPNAPLVPRHLRLHDLFPGEEHKATDPVTGRRLVLGNADVRISYAVSSLPSPLYRNAYALMINTAVTGVLGLLYWLLAARGYTAVEVGRASAAYSAMNLVSGFTAYNLVGAITRFLPQTGNRTRSWVLRTYLFSSLASIVVTIPFLLTVSHWGPTYSELTGLVPGLAFLVCVIGTMVVPFHAAQLAQRATRGATAINPWVFAGIPVALVIGVIATVLPLRAVRGTGGGLTA